MNSHYIHPVNDTTTADERFKIAQLYTHDFKNIFYISTIIIEEICEQVLEIFFNILYQLVDMLLSDGKSEAALVEPS